MKRLKNWLVPDWYQMILFLVGLFFVGLLLWFRLGTLTPGLSEAELMQSQAVTSLGDIRANPMNFPFKLLQLGFEQISTPTPAVRLASTFIGVGILGSFFLVLRNWYSKRVAIMGSLLFVCSAWFLHTARLGTEDIMYTLLIAALGVVIWMQKPRSGSMALLSGALLAVVLLYIPGMIWFVIPLMIWQMRRITRFIQRQSPILLTLLTFAGLAVIAPLILALYQQPELLRPYFGLPDVFPAPLEFLRNIAGVPIQLFVDGPDNPALWLGNVSLLSWFGIIMFIIGAYAYWFYRKLDRTKFIAYVFIAGTILIGLDGPVAISVLLPFAYLLVASGIGLMLQQWFTVFPHNPVARTFGPTLMTIAVIMTAYFHINHYFIAWPNTPETKQAFTSQQAEKPE